MIIVIIIISGCIYKKIQHPEDLVAFYLWQSPTVSNHSPSVERFWPKQCV
jgi:hypothetical protein